MYKFLAIFAFLFMSCSPDSVIDNFSTLGCTDSLACNYLDDAYIDDGSCEYPLDHLGCGCIYRFLEKEEDGVENAVCPEGSAHTGQFYCDISACYENSE